MGELYRLRWQVALFLKWIKLHLRIKAFFGTSENAVRTQIWIAVATYVLIAIVKRGALLPQAHALRGAGLVDLDEDEQQARLLAMATHRPRIRFGNHSTMPGNSAIATTKPIMMKR